MVVMKSLYLALYNGVLCIGWTYTLICAVWALHETGVEGVYSAVESPLLIFQTAAILEVVHSLLGIVRAPVSAAVPQISSRIFLTWGISWTIPEVRGHWLFTMMVLSWAITEVIRYGFFAIKEAFGGAPYFFLWLRYSSFLPLYPSGMVSEIGMLLLALPFIKAADIYSYKMPNKMNFAFDYYYFSIGALMLWAPGCPYMYTYMLSQRKRALAPEKPKLV